MTRSRIKDAKNERLEEFRSLNDGKLNKRNEGRIIKEEEIKTKSFLCASQTQKKTKQLNLKLKVNERIFFSYF